MKDKRNKAEYKTLLSVLAHGATDDAQKILVKNNIPEATTYEELEYNLAKIYSNTTDKIALEKNFAEIHPHSKFILKYLSPKPVVEEKKEPQEVVEFETTQPTIVEMKSDASGDCGCHSSAEGFVGSKIDVNTLALVSIVAIVGLVIVTRPKI